MFKSNAFVKPVWKHLLAVLLLVFLAIAMLSTAFAGKPPQPPSGPPSCAGNPISILNTDRCGKSMTIKVFDSTAVCDITCFMTRPRRANYTCPVAIPGWIGGVVIADPNAQWGFRFDSTTIVIAEVTVEGMQTNICQMAQHPEMYADGRIWYIPAGLSNLTQL
jgi:hypothetical protein